MTELAYVDGEFVPLGEAKVSIQDRGFVFADGVYEVLVAYGGRVFMLEEHLDRLGRSAVAIKLALPLDSRQITQVIEEGIRRSGYQDTMIYIQVTRGIAPRSHAFPEEARPNFVATFQARPEVPAEVREAGVSIITTE